MKRLVLHLKFSWRLFFLLFFIHILAAWSVIFIHILMGIKIFLLLGVGLSFYWHCYKTIFLKHPKSIHVCYWANGQWKIIRQNGECVFGILQKNCFISSKMVILNFKCPYSLPVLIMKDSLKGLSYRCLVRWLTTGLC